MNVRLLRGLFFNVDGYAINDFQTMSVGTVSNLNFGVSVNGGVIWEDSIIGEPRPPEA